MVYYSKSREIIEQITFGALFAALAIILKLFITFETNFIRISVFEIPIILSGILLGPLYGAFVGFTTDAVYMMVNIRGLDVSFNLFTVASILNGFLPGLFFRFIRYNKKSISLIVPITLFIAFLINTTQLYFWQKNGMFALLPWRLSIFVLKIPLEIILISSFINYKNFYQFNIYKSFSKRHSLYQE